MNRKAIVFLIVLAALSFAGCHRHYQQSEPVTTNPASTIVPTKSPETIKPVSTPKPREGVDVEFAAAYIDDAVISIDLPLGIVQNDTMDLGRIYSASGYASDTQQGNFYTVEVLRFFAEEDILANMEDLLLYDESMETFALGKDIEYRNLVSQMTFADGTGHISKTTYHDTEKYTATLLVGEIYYRIIIQAKGSYSSDDMALKILTSIQMNGSKASAKAKSFKSSLAGITYHSKKLEGASILCPADWLPAESMHFSLSNSILSMMTADKYATATVRYYSKASLPDVKTYDDFVHYMLLDLLNRSLIEPTETDRIQTFVEADKRSFCMPPTDNIIIRYYLEYTDGYYCIEMMYKGTDANVVAQMLDMGESFVGVGEEIRH
ncbi:MAG: hypothetical protein AB1Z23_03310 [Eubacteriales bacterium]